MALVRPLMAAGEVNRQLMPGDLLGGAEDINAGLISTAGSGTWTAAAIANGIIRRTGPGAGYTDTTDTSINIMAAISGNFPAANVQRGTSFRMLFINTVAFAMTFAAGTGVVSGLGTLGAAASVWREYLFTVLAASPTVTVQGNTTNTSPTVTFVFPPGVAAWPIGSDPRAINITPGMTISNANFAAGTTVLSVTQGVGGITGFVASANASATSSAGGVPIQFMPTIKIDGLRSGTL